MGPAHTKILEAVRSIAEPLGASVDFKHGTKHSYVLIRFPETFRKLTFSNGTVNLKHQIDWARQNTRRALKSMGRPFRDSDENPEGGA